MCVLHIALLKGLHSLSKHEFYRHCAPNGAKRSFANRSHHSLSEFCEQLLRFFRRLPQCFQNRSARSPNLP